MKLKRIVINGYYGMGNAGDEAVLACALEEISKAAPGSEITVLSGNPGYTGRVYGVRSAGRMGLAALREIAACDLYVSGGGSLLQDVTSAASAMYYIALMLFARLAGRKYAVYANGVGPLKRGWVRWFAKAAVEGASSVSVRDPGSLRLLEEIGVARRDVILASDPVFAIRPASLEDVLKAVEGCCGRQTADALKACSGRIAVLSLRPWKGLDAGMESLSRMVGVLRDGGFFPVGLALQPDADMGPLEALSGACREGFPVVPCDFHPRVAAGLIRMAGATVGMRLHSLIISASQAVPAFGISYDPKVDALYEMMPLGRYVKVEELMDRGEGELRAFLSELPESRRKIADSIAQIAARAADAAAQMVRRAES
ncbi:MAG TPA: polysaccharide pyruvyl transferase CsaB [Bacillota bacterium]|nr:polysaccharide pyruvyl transferase CsaB [Bacillota bacterium]